MSSTLQMPVHLTVVFNNVACVSICPEKEQHLYVRLFLRKYQWLRVDKISYVNIATDLSPIVTHLIQCGFLLNGDLIVMWAIIYSTALIVEPTHKLCFYYEPLLRAVAVFKITFCGDWLIRMILAVSMVWCACQIRFARFFSSNM